MLNLLLSVLITAAPQDSWTSLPLPELCEESNPSAHLPALRDFGHILLDERVDAPRRTVRALLTAQDVSSLLERSAAAAGRNLSFFPYSPPLLAQGSAEDLEWARASLGAMDAAGRRNRLKISAWLVPQSGSAIPADGAQLPNAMHWTTTVQPGEEVAFGERRQQDFVASYDVNVSTDSGVAAPLIGGVFSGKTVHLSASRVRGGEGYYLRGFLDLSELSSLDEFDPDTPDLGKLRQPLINVASLVFSGSAANGETLRVEIDGAPLAQPDWTLLVRVDGEAEPLGPGSAADAGLDWRAVDVSLLSKRSPNLPSFDPGAGLDSQAALDSWSSQSATITSSGVMSAVETSGRSRRSNAGRASEAAVQICEGLLLVSAEPEVGGLAERLIEFMRSVEAPRLATSIVELQSGSLRARFPVAAGEAARLTVGLERTLLTGYEAEIAPNTWMPSPVVERSFDGLAWQGRSSGDQLTTSLWRSRTDEVLVVDRLDAQLGAVQLPKRSVRGARKTVRFDSESTELLSPAEGSAGVKIELTRP